MSGVDLESPLFEWPVAPQSSLFPHFKPSSRGAIALLSHRIHHRSAAAGESRWESGDSPSVRSGLLCLLKRLMKSISCKIKRRKRRGAPPVTLQCHRMRCGAALTFLPSFDTADTQVTHRDPRIRTCRTPRLGLDISHRPTLLHGRRSTLAMARKVCRCGELLKAGSAVRVAAL